MRSLTLSQKSQAMSAVRQKRVGRRIIIIAFFSTLWLAAIVIRLIQLQVFEHPRLRADVLEQNQNEVTIFPQRGTIYDRSGSILARSVPRKSVYYYAPSASESKSAKTEKIIKLRSILDLSDYELQRIKTCIDKGDSFIWIKRKIDPAVEKNVEELSLAGIYLTEENKRFYPQGKLAAHLLGRVNIDDVGASGIEGRYNSVLQGKKGKYLILKDAKKRKYRFETREEPASGKDLILTLDETIQYYAEKELEAAVTKTGANWGTVIVSRPSTGEILALANTPVCDLNSPSPNIIDRNKAIHHNFEPGSIFKVVTFAAAIETGKIKLNSAFDCSKGYIQVAGKTIKDHERFGVLSFPQVLIHSSNVGTIQISQSVGEDEFSRMIRAFGFGQRTGIDLPAEEYGMFRPVENWTRISLASLSIGYEVSATSIQMLQAINIIANKGVATCPYVVKKIMSFPEDAIKRQPKQKRVISEKTALLLISMLEKVVEEGTGVPARINGYRIAGKTGTAQKFDPLTRSYSSRLHTSSFFGFVPSDNPLISIVVVLDEPKIRYYGGEVSAPVFKEVASRVLRYLRVPVQEGPLDKIRAENRWRHLER